MAHDELFKPHVIPDTPHLVRSWGFAAGYKNTGLGGGAPDKAGADVELYEDGTFQVRSSSAEMGQGLVTVMRLVVAEEMSVPPEQVRGLVMDTDLAPSGGPTTASRQTYVTGNDSRYAAKTLRDEITATMAEKYDVRPEQIRFENGIVHINGHSLSYTEIYKELTMSGNSRGSGMNTKRRRPSRWRFPRNLDLEKSSENGRKDDCACLPMKKRELQVNLRM